MNVNFETYHAENPEIYDALLEYVMKAKSAGIHRYSIRALFHIIRWHRNVETKDPDGFKINNNYSQDYALKIMEENPNLDGFFDLRF